MSKSEEVDADVVAKIVGKWKSFKVKNLEKLMKAMGAPWAVRKLASKFSPVTEISIDGDTIVEVLQMMKTYTQELVIGAAPIKGTSGPMGPVDGLFVVWLKRGYLVTAVPERDGITVTKRVEIQDDGTLMWTITRQDVVMHRWFKRSS